MIFVDPREGSIDVLASLVRAGLPAEKASPQLAFGDLFFVGRGEKGKAVTIGIEHKTIQDAVNGMRTERLQGHQAPGMRAEYDYCWLLLEGDIEYDAQGRLVRRVSRSKSAPMGMTVGEFYKRLTILHLCGGINWVHCRTRRDTVKWIDAFYHALTDKDLDQHKSHLGIYSAPSLAPVPQFHETVRTLPNVGAQVASAAKKRFKSLHRAFTATSGDWASLETVDRKGHTRKFGTAHAQDVMDAIHKETT